MPRFKSLIAVTVLVAVLVEYRLRSTGVFPVSNPLPALPDVPTKIINMTNKVEIIGNGQLVGPESILCGGNFLFLSLGDGRIARLEEQSNASSGDVSWTFLTRTGPGEHCGFSPADVDDTESTCGRPLGMKIVKRSSVDPKFSKNGATEEDVLVVADASQGLLMITGIYEESNRSVNVVTLARRANTDPKEYRFQLLNALVQAPDGSIYISETSQTFPRRRIFYAALDGRQTGRLLRYTKEKGVNVVQENLYMPNGLTLSHNRQNIIMVAGVRVQQFSIAQQKMIDDLVSILPGTGDNIDAMEHLPSGEKRKCYWLGLGSKYSKPFSLLHLVSDKPWLKTFLVAMVPYKLFVNAIPKMSALAVYDEVGNLIEIYQDDSKVAPWLSEGESWGDYVYLGSWYNPFLARVKL